MINKAFICGNLTRDPEVRYTPQNVAVCEFSLAVSRRLKTKDGAEKEKVLFIKVLAWGKLGELCGQHLTKGSEAMVEGEIIYEKWEKEGRLLSEIKIRADEVKFIRLKACDAAAPYTPPAEGMTPASAGAAEDDPPLPF